MKYLIRSILILLFSIQTYAADVYDSKTGILTIGTVSVGDVLYSNVKVTVGNILSVGVVEIDDSYDQYNAVNNQLQIPVVSVGEQKYFNVIINVGDILSVGSSCNGIEKCYKNWIKNNCGDITGKVAINSHCQLRLFSYKPTLLPDLRGKFDQLCGNLVHTQNAIPIDLNKDGRIDLVFNMWCKYVDDKNNASTKSTFVVLIQNNMGEYEDKTKDIFGEDNINIGGVGYGYIVKDLNNDGYEDIVIACNLEDGRPIDGACPQISFISNGKGQYQFKPFVTLVGDDVKVYKNNKGETQVLLIPANSSPELWIYEGTWKFIEKLSWLQKNPVFIDINGVPSIVNKYENGKKIEVWQNLNNEWIKKTEYNYLIPITAKIGSSSNSSNTNIFKLDGNYYKDYGGLYEGCALSKNKDSPKEVIYQFLGAEIKNGYSGQILVDEWEPPTNKLIMLGINSIQIKINPITLKTNLLDSNNYHFECNDYNLDGYEDILIRTSGTPLIYINDQNGGYKTVKKYKLPIAPNGSSHIYVDLDGDGIKDFLYFPIDRWQFGNNISDVDIKKVQFFIHYGKRGVNYEDLE